MEDKKTTDTTAAPKKGYEPFNQAVNDKTYSMPPTNGGVNPADLIDPIPEPIFMPPPKKETPKQDAVPFTAELMEQEAEQRKKDNKRKEEQTYNPGLSSLSDKEKHESAAVLAKQILWGYEQLNKSANGLLKIPERKLMRLQQSGEIDLRAQIPYDLEKMTTVGTFAKLFNDQIADTFVVSKEFKREAEPVLTRVLAKRGHGLSDEQHLIFLFGRDAAVKTATFVQLRKQVNSFFDFAKNATEAMRAQGGSSVPYPNDKAADMRAQPQEAAYQPPPPQPPPQPQAPVVNMDVYPAQGRSPLDIQNEFTGANAKAAGQAEMPTFGDPAVLSRQQEIYEAERVEADHKLRMQEQTAQRSQKIIGKPRRAKRNDDILGKTPAAGEQKPKRAPGRPPGSGKKSRRR